MRADGAGGTKETIEFLARRRVSYSVGFILPDHTSLSRFLCKRFTGGVRIGRGRRW